MCGLTGFIDRASSANDGSLQGIVTAMTDTLSHRGPDDSDVWTDAAAGIALGFRRLSIIDLSSLGRQPMASANGRYVMVYNGEVYNFGELHAELEAAGHRFRGHSDTEVILEGCAAWGIGKTIRRLIGMFAIALWDRETRTLTLARDRIGIKPLYWGRFGAMVIFGSELKALRACTAFKPELDRNALAAYLRYSYVPTPHTIYRGVFKLEPGCLLTIGADGEPHRERYWDLREFAAASRMGADQISETEATDQLDDLLGDAVRRRMVADVPVGAFLSSGVDSSTVVALMQKHSNRPVRTFTIGFHEKGYNEAVHAKAIAAHLGTDHTELYVDSDHARDLIPRMADIFDEPFADPTQLPTYLISELARRDVTVSLSGDGGDELFAGYGHYFWAQQIQNKVRRVPLFLRRATAALVTAIPPSAWDRMFSFAPVRISQDQPGDRVHKIGKVLVRNDPNDIYRQLSSRWDEPDRLVIDGHEPPDLLRDEGMTAAIPDYLDRMLYVEAMTYLPDDNLARVDRTSMAVSLEVRVPILDHRVVEYAWRLPSKFATRTTPPKALLRNVLYRYVPQALVDRPKVGFLVPIDTWLRGSLRDWAEDLLDEKKLKEEGVFDPAPVRWVWDQHRSGRGNWQFHIWNILMFQAWQRRWM